MPGITISNAMRSRLPAEERDDIEDFLWAKSHGVCHLCGDPLNRASESIEADHDIPEAEGGPTNRANLELAHATPCNRTKRNNPSVDVRPYLKLMAFARRNQNVVHYREAQAHFGITPEATVITWSPDSLHFEFPDGSIVDAPIFRDPAIGRDPFEYVFVSVPRNALFNDDECQPRTIKLLQVWSIYRDLRDNPLHEPPSCRLIHLGGDRYQLAMFDGQHKTIANWMKGSERVTVKIYLNIDRQDTIRLVNSIQAKIKKLPLSSFELSAKMSDEWADQFARYEETVDPSDASEAGFINWLPASDRARGKQAFQLALARNLLDSPDLALLRFVDKPGTPPERALMTETTFSKKVLERLIYTKPLTETGDDGQRLRLREKENITAALNILAEMVFEPDADDGALSPQDLIRRKRMAYQSSLAYVSGLLRSLYRQILAVEPDRAMMERIPNETQMAQIRDAIRRLVEHPVWTADFELSEKTKAVGDALSKNQDAKAAFEAVGLKLGYLIGADELSGDCLD
jgi:hypothetical protein